MKKANKNQAAIDHNKHFNVRMEQGNENLNRKTLPKSKAKEPLHHLQRKTVAALQRSEAALDVNNNAFSGENAVGNIFERKGSGLDDTTHGASSLSKQVESGGEYTRESTGAEGQNLVDFEEEIEEVLPWHHLQLYNFMGKEADYFLYPKLDMEKRAAKPLTTPIGNTTGYNSVHTLWAALREDSSKRLCARVDDNISPELKATYRAYIREYMKGRDAEDKEEQLLWGSTQVPDIEELLDDSCLRKITERRRKVQIMFRSALRNEDRTKILLYNNPLPDINNDSGTDNIMRFLLPSPMKSSPDNKLSPDNRGDKSEELSHRPNDENADDSIVSNGIGDKEIGAEHDEFVWGDFDGHGKQKPVKCVFLTEADACSVGRFSRKRKELMDAKAIDTQYMQIQDSRQDSAPRPIKDNQRTSAHSTMTTGKKKTSPPAVSYQPLTLGALMEYAAKCSAPGHGSFKFGTRPMWIVEEKT